MPFSENKNCFDFLRIFFCLNILLSHLAGLSQSQSLKFLQNYANSLIGVQGFFVISGFLVAKSYTNTTSIKEYFLKRTKRILPAYFFVVLFMAVFLSLFSTYNLSDYFSDLNVLKYVGWNLIFLNFMHPCLPGLFENNVLCAVNGALWTLKVEEAFYLFLPIIFYFIRKTKKPIIVITVIYILSIIYWYFMETMLHKPVLAKQMPGYLSFFGIGIALYLNLNKLILYKNQIFILALLTLLISIYINFEIDFFYPASFGTLVILSAYNLKFLNNFGKYGDFTYGLYIYHFPVIQVFRHYNLFEKYNPFLMSFYVLAITFMFSIFSWFVIEKRFLNRYKNIVIS